MSHPAEKSSPTEKSNPVEISMSPLERPSPSGTSSTAGRSKSPLGRPSPAGMSNPAGRSKSPLGRLSPAETSNPAGRSKSPLGRLSPTGTSNPAGRSKSPLGMPSPAVRSKSPLGMPSPTGRSKSPLGMPSPAGTSNPVGRSKSPLGMPSPAGRSKSPSGMPSPAGRSKSPLGMPSPAGRSKSPLGMTSPAGRSKSPLGMPSPAGRSKSPLGMPSPAGRSKSPLGMPSPAGRSKSPLGMTSPAGRSKSPLGMPSPAGRSKSPLGMPSPAGRSKSPLRMPSPAKTSNPAGRSKSPLRRPNPAGTSKPPSRKSNPTETSDPAAKPIPQGKYRPPLGKSKAHWGKSKPPLGRSKPPLGKSRFSPATKSDIPSEKKKQSEAKKSEAKKSKAKKSKLPVLLLSPPERLVESLKDHRQEDVLRFWEELSPQNRQHLVKDLQRINLQRVDRIIRWSLEFKGLPPVDPIEPVTDACVCTVGVRTLEDRVKWWNMGLKAISEGELALVLLSGGQGTRLGCSEPKGCFDIGLHSKKSLFQLQAERIFTVQKLAAKSVKSASVVQIHWYIMTSPFNDKKIQEFFKTQKYFGLQADQITFFKQGILPCFSKDGKFIMETRFSVAKAPDGNGAVYSALKSSKLLDDMTKRGVKYVDFCGVDNALVRVGDPSFLGYFIDKGVSAAAKVVRKAYPQEEVGVFVQSGTRGHLSVIDYTELDPSLASSLKEENGQLLFCWTNRVEKENIYHLAERKIPSVSGSTDGYKPEKFVFDAIPLALSSTTLFEALRGEEYAPVTNRTGSKYDTPESAKRLLITLHARWVIGSGGGLSTSEPSIYHKAVEISPLCSYAGENLASVCRGNSFYGPTEIVRYSFH